VTQITPPVGTLDGLARALEPEFRLDQLVALSAERALYRAWDRVLKRFVALQVHLARDTPGRDWFQRETETLAALEHPAIRRVYAASEREGFAYRTVNWIDGEGLADALRRGPRPIPTVHGLVRDLLGALEHAHAREIILRRIVPTALMLGISGRPVVTDLRHSNWCVGRVRLADDPAALPFTAPEIRDGADGEPASDVYAAGALMYHAVTGQSPDPDPERIVPPSRLRSAVPTALERVILRALARRPEDRYYTATEMLEDFVRDAGTFHEPGTASHVADPGFERRLRRALGDDYELLDEIGGGGFGRVYRVRDLSLEREVAMKVLHPARTADLGVLERFRREAQFAARLRHPNIVSIYDIGGRAGLQWYTMELVPGPNLSQLVQQEGRLSVERTHRLLTEALSATEHAHSVGLVHRDLKPENMLIEADGRLRITDLGLAVALHGEGRFGGASSRSGTPHFAAPEQLLGERVDQRTDLYSLGAVAYFALLGSAPFQGPTAEAILARQTRDDIPALNPIRPDVPREFEAVVRRAVLSDPAARYQSAHEFREALRTWGGLLRRLLLVFRGS
jgi:serine/threonine-protein kinase